MSTRYQIVRKLGSGGMADVYLARSTSAGGFEKWVALKQIRPEAAQSREMRALFLREVRLGASLDHPNLVQCFDGGLRGDRLYLVQEVVDGGDLRGVIRAMRQGGPRLTPSAVAHLGRQACHALSFVFSVKDEAGQPLIRAHRDISPGNLLVTRTGQLKLGDIGVARLGKSQTAVGVVGGKWEYFAPELARGVVDGRGDLFALSTVLYELLALNHPFDSETPQGHFERARSEAAQRPQECPEALWDVLARGLARDGEERWPTPRVLRRGARPLPRRAGRRLLEPGFSSATGAAPAQAGPEDPRPSLRAPAGYHGRPGQPAGGRPDRARHRTPGARGEPGRRRPALWPGSGAGASRDCLAGHAAAGAGSPPRAGHPPRAEEPRPAPVPPPRRRGRGVGLAVVALGVGVAARSRAPRLLVASSQVAAPLPLVTSDSQPDLAEVYSGAGGSARRRW